MVQRSRDGTAGGAASTFSGGGAAPLFPGGRAARRAYSGSAPRVADARTAGADGGTGTNGVPGCASRQRAVMRSASHRRTISDDGTADEGDKAEAEEEDEEEDEEKDEEEGEEEDEEEDEEDEEEEEGAVSRRQRAQTTSPSITCSRAKRTRVGF